MNNTKNILFTANSTLGEYFYSLKKKNPSHLGCVKRTKGCLFCDGLMVTPPLPSKKKKMVMSISQLPEPKTSDLI